MYYFQNRLAIDSFDDGLIAFDAVYAMEFGDIALKVAPTFAYYLDDTVTA